MSESSSDQRVPVVVEPDPDAPAVDPAIKERMERLKLDTEHLRCIEALKVATNALALYAKPSTWGEDDWGIKAVNKAEYGDAGKRARNAIKRIDRVTRPDYIPKGLRDE